MTAKAINTTVYRDDGKTVLSDVLPPEQIGLPTRVWRALDIVRVDVYPKGTRLPENKINGAVYLNYL